MTQCSSYKGRIFLDIDKQRIFIIDKYEIGKVKNMEFQILATFKQTVLVWGREEETKEFVKKIAIGTSFLAYATSLVDEETVRFRPEPCGIHRHCKASEFLLRVGEKVPFSFTESYECAEDCLEDIVTGFVELIPAENGNE